MNGPPYSEEERASRALSWDCEGTKHEFRWAIFLDDGRTGMLPRLECSCVCGLLSLTPAGNVRMLARDEDDGDGEE